MKTTASALLVLAFIAGINPLQAVEWTQYRGPAADGNSPEKWKLTSFPSNGLPRT